MLLSSNFEAHAHRCRYSFAGMYKIYRVTIYFMNNPLRLADYESLGVALSNLYFSEQTSHQARLEPWQHQLVLALKRAVQGKEAEDWRAGEAAADSASQRGRTGKPARLGRPRAAASRSRGSAGGAAVSDCRGREHFARSCRYITRPSYACEDLRWSRPLSSHARRQWLQGDRDQGFVK